MKALIVLCALVAYSHARPGWAYSSIDLGSHAYVAAPTFLAARTLTAAPVYAAASAIHAAPVISAAPAIHAAPVISAAPATLVEATPVVAAAPAAPAVVEARTVATAAPVVAAAPAVEARTVVAAAPVVTAARTDIIAAAPAAVVAAPAAVKTQYHAQDELGQASYGHAEPLQTHTAVQDAHGNKVGSFSYLNPTDGLIHRTDYVADALGYRVAANDLPVGPARPVVDTPEVAIAKAAHLEAVSKARVKRGVVIAAGHTPASTAPLVSTLVAAAPAITTYAAPISPIVAAAAPAVISYSAPAVLAAAPALRAATLTTVVNTPGHAVSYRVD